MYLLQRVSGLGILLFLLGHVGMTRVWGMLNPGVHTDLFGHMQWALSQPWIFGIYALGLLLSVFHLANGLGGMALVWGLAPSPLAQRRISYACAGLGVLRAAWGFHGLIGFLP